MHQEQSNTQPTLGAIPSSDDIFLNDPLLQDPDAVPSGDSVDKFKFEDDIQNLILGAILTDRDFLAFAADVIEPENFTIKGANKIAAIALEMWRNFGEMPTKVIMQAELKSRAKNDKSLTVYLAMVNLAYDYLPELKPLKWLRDQCVRFAKIQNVRKLNHRFLTAIQKGESDFDSIHQEYVDSIAKLQGTTATNFELFSPDELANLEGLEWAIEGHFPKMATVCVFGSSGAGKSFVCLDMALSVATGTDFLGKHEVKAGRVLYINSEGSYNLKSRYAAWREGHQVSSVKNIVFSTVSHNLQDRAEVEMLIQKATAKLGGIDVVFIDTLSRNFGPGDTDKNADMQAYLRSVDLIREKTKAAVVNVHHTGWSDTERERGAKSLRDYCDTSICVLKVGTDEIEVSCKKQKDAAEFEPYRLRKMNAEGSLYLELIGTKREAEEVAAQIETDDRLTQLIQQIPDLDLSVVETETNTVSSVEIRDRTGWSNGKISQLLGKLTDGGQISKRRFGDSRTPWRYFRRSQIAP